MMQSINEFLELSDKVCGRLQAIHLNGVLGALGRVRFQALCNTLSRCSKLQTLDLKGNDLDELDAARLQVLGEALSRCSKLQALNLEGCNLGALDATRFQAFCVALSGFTKLQNLNLWNNKLGKLDRVRFQALCNALSSCSELQALDLGGNDLGTLNAAGFQTLCRGLSRCQTLIEIPHMGKFTKERQTVLTTILNKNLNFIQEVKNTLDSSLPFPKLPHTLQGIVMDYMLPKSVFFRAGETNVLSPQTGKPRR